MFNRITKKSNRSKALSLRHKSKYDKRKSDYALESNYSQHILNKDFIHSTEDGLSLISAFVLTDGWISWNRNKKLFALGFSNTNGELSLAFRDLVFICFNEVPSCINTTRGLNVVRYVAPWHQKMITRIRNHCFIDKKKSARNILKTENDSIQKECIRIAFSCDGYISFEISTEKYGFKKKYYSRLRPALALGCTPKKMRMDWMNTLKKVGIKTQFKKDRLKTNSWHALMKFWSFGGFLDETFIGKDSCFFCGLEKNEIIKRLILIKRQKLQNRQSDYRDSSYLKKIIISIDK